MDIERLKELKSWVSDLRKFGVNEGNEIIVLIDAEIARQSVKSEDAKEAISHIQGGYGDIWQWPKKRRDTTITALQAYEPKPDCESAMGRIEE